MSASELVPSLRDSPVISIFPGTDVPGYLYSAPAGLKFLLDRPVSVSLLFGEREPALSEADGARILIFVSVRLGRSKPPPLPQRKRFAATEEE